MLLHKRKEFMKSRLLLAILAAGCFSSEVRSDAVLAITEINESLTVTFNGSGPFGKITELGPESWDVQLPTGYTFLNAIVGGTFFVGEPENALEVNTVTIRDSTTLNWVSDVPVPVTAATGFDNPFVLADGGTLPDQSVFALTLRDITTAPDPGSTLLLSATGLIALGALRASKIG